MRELYSHLAVGEDLQGRTYTMLQANRLNIWDEAFKKLNINFKTYLRYIFSYVFPRTPYDMVRVGIGMYGLWPSKETKLAMQKIQTLPCFILKSIITEIKNYQKTL